MNHYYTHYEGRVLIWRQGAPPMLFNVLETLDGDSSRLRYYFERPETMVYVPWEIVQILTNG